MTISTWLLFLSVSLAAAFSPGPGVLMAISTASAMGPRRALFSSAGNAAGVFTVAAVAASGLGLLLQASALAFSVLKIAGAGYLIYLGVRVWRNDGAVSSPAAAAAMAADDKRWQTFQRGLMVALSNPKSILFFTAVFPQFMPPDHIDVPRFLLLTSTFTACTLASHFFYVVCASWLKRGVRTTAARRRWAKRSTALVFVGMGGALLTLSRH